MFPLSSAANESKYPFHAGFIVSFLASLPPGIVNILTIQLAITESYMVAFRFAIGALAAEIICAKVCLVLMNGAFKFELTIRILQWLVLVILLALSVTSFIASAQGNAQAVNNPLRNDLSPFIFGFLTMAINPGLIPFWLGWTTIFFQRKILRSDNGSEIAYLAGIALGSLIASGLFIGGGHFLFSALVVKEQTLHFIFGCVFSIMAIVYAFRLPGLKRDSTNPEH
jgi:threonine/homoserine/homoserine lactone efflux protein